MSKGRLTRQELGWLLTQEAAGAASRLRQGVQVMRSIPPPSGLTLPPAITDADPHVEESLDALDDMMRMLSTLHARPGGAGQANRRGRIDLAALLWEVSPEARVQIEPGSGTEVSGDEAELRRMLHVLVGHGSGLGSSSVNIRREGANVRIAVVLGPDSSPTMETERAWLSRMATRYGGSHELQGGTEVLVLPADGEREEREALRRELDEARKQGEAYARELAAVMERGEEVTAASSYPPMPVAKTTDRLDAVVRVAGGLAAELRATLAPISRVSGEGEDTLESIKRRIARAQDLTASLASFGELSANELPASLDLDDVVAGAIAQLGPRAARAEVKVSVRSAAPAVRSEIRAPAASIALLVRETVSQAIQASQRGGQVLVTISTDETGSRIYVDDAGSPLPASARRMFLTLSVEPRTYGRPSSISLFMCAEIAACHGARLELSDAPFGGLRVTVTFPR